MDEDGVLHVHFPDSTWRHVRVPGLQWPATHPLAVNENALYVLGAAEEGAAVWRTEDMSEWTQTTLSFSRAQESLVGIAILNEQVSVVGFENPMSWERPPYDPAALSGVQRGFRLWSFQDGSPSGTPIFLSGSSVVYDGYPPLIASTATSIFIGGDSPDGPLLYEIGQTGAILNHSHEISTGLTLSHIESVNEYIYIFGDIRGGGGEIHDIIGVGSMHSLSGGVAGFRSSEPFGQWEPLNFVSRRVTDPGYADYTTVQDLSVVGDGIVAVGTSGGAAGQVWTSVDGVEFTPTDSSSGRDFYQGGYVDAVAAFPDRVIAIGKVGQVGEDSWLVWEGLERCN